MRILACLLCAVALCASAADAAIVYLKDGGRISGTVVGATARDVTLYTPDGTLKISTDRIASIDYQGAAAPSGAAPSAPPTPSAPPVYQPERVPQHSRFARGEREPAGPNYISLDLGIAAPLSDVRFPSSLGGSASNGDVGAALGFDYFHYISPRLALGGEFQWLDRGPTDSFGLLNSADSRVSADTVLFMGLLKYDFTESGDARPYVVVGAGVHHTNEIVDARPIPGFAWSDTGTDERRRLVDDSASGAAGTLRLGVDLYALEPSVLTFEAGWTALSGAAYKATPAGQALGLDNVSGPQQVLTILFKWGWRF